MKRTLTLRRPAPLIESLPRRHAGAIVPLSFGQEQIWLHGELAPDVPLYNESLTLRHRGPLDVMALTEAFTQVAGGHEIWRTTFAWAGGGLVQRVHSGQPPLLALTDLRQIPAELRECRAHEIAATDLRRPFDLGREFGVRARLVLLDEEDQRLYLCLHHIVFDGISIYRVFLPELARVYRTRLDGALEPSPAPTLQYGDYACWQRGSTDEASLRSLEGWWRSRLAGAPATTTLPPDRPRPARPSFRSGLVRFTIPPALTTQVRLAAREQQSTLFMFLLAAFAAALARRAGQADLVIGSVAGGRDRPELDRLIGYFLRTLVLRIDLGRRPTYRDLLARVRESVLETLAQDGLPFQRLVQGLRPPREPGQSPFFQVTFTIEPPLPDLGEEWDITEMDAGPTAAKFDLSVELEDRGAAVAGRAIYAEDLYEEETVRGLIAGWTELLGRVVVDPDLEVGLVGEASQGCGA